MLLNFYFHFEILLLTSLIRNSSTAVREFSKYESRILADAINERLPRELRDMIWHMCWEEKLNHFDHYDMERPWRAFEYEPDEQSEDDDDDDACSGCSGPIRSPLRERLLRYYYHPAPNFANPLYVGEDAAREAVEAFYRVAPAYLEILGTEEVQDYFEKDDFAMVVVPRDHITSIIIFLSACMGRSFYVNSASQPMALSLSDEALRSMVHPDRKKIPDITFFIWQEPLTKALETLDLGQTLYHQLKAIGARIKVIYQAYEHSFDVPLGPNDLGDIMEMPRSAWDSHFRKGVRKQMGKKASKNGLDFWV